MKKFTKRTICLLLSLVLILTTLFALNIDSVFGATSGLAGSKITWSYNTTSKTLTLSGTGATYDFRATSLGTNKKVPWSEYISEIESVVVKEGITDLGQYAFFKCTALTSVSLPSTLKSIGGMGTMTTSYGCFQECTALDSITLPEGLEKIDNCAFKNCTALTSVILPNSLTTLGYGAFAECNKITSVTFGEGITDTGSNTFYNCTALKNITWGGIKRVSTYAFYGFFGASIEFPDSIEYIGFRSFAENYNIRNITINNPDCEIVTSNATEQVSPFAGHQQNVTVYGHSGSTAQALASTYNYTFISLDPCDHLNTYERVSVEPTCLEIGKLQLVCSDCGQVVKTSDIEPLGHDYQVTETVDNTTVDGHIYTTEECSRCGDTQYLLEHAKTGETSPRYVWVEGYYTYTNTATCTRPGVERYTCTVEGCKTAGIQTQETISASAGKHTVENWTIIKEPTCTENGSRKGTCTVCGAETTEVINATGHVYSTEKDSPDLLEVVSTEDSQDGHRYYIYECQKCGELAVIPEHVDWLDGGYTSQVVSQPHCVVDGLRHDTCLTEGCGATRNVVLPANGEHEWYETSRTEPSCTVAGQIYYACKNCNLTKTERSEALGHDYIKVEESSKAPTCTENGYDFEKCSRCSSTRQTTVEKLGHTVDKNNYIVNAEPTCEDKGSAVSVCTVCGANFEIELEPLGHDYQDVVEDLTNENKPGHSLVTPVCTRCNSRLAASIRHDEWIPGKYTTAETIPSTCNVQGYSTDTCTICKETRKNYYKVLGHNYNYVGDNEYTEDALASVTHEGMLYRCSICQRTERIDALTVYNYWQRGTYVNSKDIKRTGPIDDGYDYSSMLDANGDNIINAKDYAIIKRCYNRQIQLKEIYDARLKIAIKVDGATCYIDLEDNDSARELYDMLPMTVTLKESNSNQKTCTLDEKLTSNPKKVGVIQKGELMLYGNDTLVFFYGNAVNSNEYTKLGTCTNDNSYEDAFTGDDITATIYAY